MLRNGLKGFLIGGAVVASIILAGQASADTNIRMEAPSAGSSPYVLEVALQSVWQKYLPVKVNLTASMASTRSALNASKGQVDFYLSAPSINSYMKNGSHMFSGISDARDLYKNLRSVFNFPLGKTHIMVHADSGITSLKGIKGKRVFIGPPGGAATDNAIKIISAVTGYKPGVDYKMARLDWTSGRQAFQDDQVVLYMAPSQVPGPGIEQITLLEKVRLLDIPEAAFSTPEMREVMNTPGNSRAEIAPNAYGDQQVNTKPVHTIASWVGIGTNKSVDADLVYQCTKAAFDHLDEIHASAKFLKSVNMENALKEMQAPLHVGALRYFREKGIKVPEDLIPPEAKQ